MLFFVVPAGGGVSGTALEFVVYLAILPPFLLPGWLTSPIVCGDVWSIGCDVLYCIQVSEGWHSYKEKQNE